jgi:FkbM family methyltransferase
MKKQILSIYRKIGKFFLKCGLQKLPFVRSIDNFIRSFLKSDFAIVDGHKMFLDSGDYLQLSTRGVCEKLTTEIIKKEVKKGNIVLDLGANIGYYSLILAKLVGKNGRVFAFEPDPVNFAILKKNIQINNYQNVVAYQKAVSNQSGTLRLYQNPKNPGAHTIYQDFKENRTSIKVKSIKLDDYFQNHKLRIDFIKMDIEGAEAAALLGMMNILKRNKKIKIITEFQPLGLERSGFGARKFLELLKELGFKLYEIDEEKKIIKPAVISDLLKKYTPIRRNHVNLFCQRIIK